jgi:Fe-S-cluster containining protein|tara:strand:+ start:1470 stop:2009 length:540 start_codon:yes stop_codon:yes gene_type:complete
MSKSDKSKSNSGKTKKKADRKKDRKKDGKEMSSQPSVTEDSDQKTTWYSDGLRFECTQCGDCCSGEPGYVWVEEAEIAAMATELDMPIDAFERKFIRNLGFDKSLIEYSDGDCILLDPKTRKCTVYGARPIQCRTWPFWDSNLNERKDWKATCEVCPGAGKGKLYTFDQIEAARKQKSV